VKKQLWQDVDEDDATNDASSRADSEPKPKAVNPFFRALLNASPAKSAKKTSLLSSTRPSTAPVSTPSKMLGKSPKRKRSPSADFQHTPGTSAKKHRPLGFLTSSPRLSPPPPVAAVAPGNNNRTPVMFKQT
jgi:hypothetical protein